MLQQPHAILTLELDFSALRKCYQLVFPGSLGNDGMQHYARLQDILTFVGREIVCQ